MISARLITPSRKYEKRLSYYTSFNPILNVVGVYQKAKPFGDEDSTYHIDAYTLHALILQRCMTRSVSVAGYTLGYDFLRQPV